MNIGIVFSVDEVSGHIAKYGTNHTEAIVSESQAAAKRFVALSDCATVTVDTSICFTDGEKMFIGVEIGISNQKLRARGPMGLEAMTTTTWIVIGTGQVQKQRICIRQSLLASQGSPCPRTFSGEYARLSRVRQQVEKQDFGAGNSIR